MLAHLRWIIRGQLRDKCLRKIELLHDIRSHRLLTFTQCHWLVHSDESHELYRLILQDFKRTLEQINFKTDCVYDADDDITFMKDVIELLNRHLKGSSNISLSLTAW